MKLNNKSKPVKRANPYRDDMRIKLFGEKLKELRKSKNITQEQLEHLSGFDLSQIGRIERGVINTSISHVFKLAECLGVSPHEFFLPLKSKSAKG